MATVYQPRANRFSNIDQPRNVTSISGWNVLGFLVTLILILFCYLWLSLTVARAKVTRSKFYHLDGRLRERYKTH